MDYTRLMKIAYFVCAETVRLVGWLVGWLAVWLVGWLVGSLVRWFVGSLVRWFVGSLVRWFVGSLVRSFVGSLVRWFVGLLAGWLAAWLAGCVFVCLSVYFIVSCFHAVSKQSTTSTQAASSGWASTLTVGCSGPRAAATRRHVNSTSASTRSTARPATWRSSTGPMTAASCVSGTARQRSAPMCTTGTASGSWCRPARCSLSSTSTLTPASRSPPWSSCWRSAASRASTWWTSSRRACSCPCSPSSSSSCRPTPAKRWPPTSFSYGLKSDLIGSFYPYRRLERSIIGSIV